MNDKLHIAVDGEPIRVVDAEINESQQVGPRKFSGRLLNVSDEDLVKIKFGANVKVFFKAKRYRFADLEKDGTFELRQDW
jgi:hypothetical protein